MTAHDAPRPAGAGLAGIGPYFAVDEWTPGGTWRPVSELSDASPALHERVDVARRAIARRAGLPVEDIDLRASASVVHLGLTARLVSPLLAAVVLHGTTPTLTIDALWWKAVDRGPWPIAWSRTPVVAGDPAATAEVLRHVAAPLVDAFAGAFALSRQVLDGNVASSLGGALTMLAAARPDVADRATDLVERLLTVAPLVGCGTLHGPPGGRRWFTRSSCCLYHRLPGGGLCGDCVLRPT